MKTAVFISEPVPYDSFSDMMHWYDISSIIITENKVSQILLKKYGAENNIPVQVVAANWDKGKSAGIKRTHSIIKKAEQIIIFSQKDSKEIDSAIRLAEESNKPLYLHSS